MTSNKTWLFLVLALTLASSNVFAWGSKPDSTSDKLNTVIEKNQEKDADKALETITEQVQEQATKSGGK